MSIGSMSQVIVSYRPGSVAETPQSFHLSLSDLVTSPSPYVFPIWIAAAFLVHIITNMSKYPPHTHLEAKCSAVLLDRKSDLPETAWL